MEPFGEPTSEEIKSEETTNDDVQIELDQRLYLEDRVYFRCPQVHGFGEGGVMEIEVMSNSEKEVVEGFGKMKFENADDDAAKNRESRRL
jgi:hypothetical protein